jgi:hypothetical protein
LLFDGEVIEGLNNNATSGTIDISDYVTKSGVYKIIITVDPAIAGNYILVQNSKEYTVSNGDEIYFPTGEPGAYIAGSNFSNREYTWDEMVANGYNGIQPYYTIEEDAPPEVVEYGEDRSIVAENHDIIVPDDVTNCGWFYINGNNIVLPETTEVVYGCDDYKIGTVYIKATIPPQLKSPAFYDCTSEDGEGFGGIVVPAGCIDAYKSATGWCDFAGHIKEAEI